MKDIFHLLTWNRAQDSRGTAVRGLRVPGGAAPLPRRWRQRSAARWVWLPPALESKPWPATHPPPGPPPPASPTPLPAALDAHAPSPAASKACSSRRRRPLLAAGFLATDGGNLPLKELVIVMLPSGGGLTVNMDNDLIPASSVCSASSRAAFRASLISKPPSVFSRRRTKDSNDTTVSSASLPNVSARFQGTQRIFDRY